MNFYNVLWTSHALYAFERQLRLVDLVGDLNWKYNSQSGVLFLGDRFRIEAEVLGTECEETGTWLWAWANEASNIPVAQQSASLKLRALGEKRRIVELTKPMNSLDLVNGFTASSIAVGEGLGKAYYRCPYEGGAAFVLITDMQLELQVDEPLQRILTLLPHAISMFELPDHRVALRGYLGHYGLKTEGKGEYLFLRQRGEETLRAEFDEHGRLRELKRTFGKKEQTTIF